MRIAIAGAGIGGLAAAALLADGGHDVALFDQFAAPQPLGSGLVIQPVGQAVLDVIGAGATARANGAALHRMAGHAATTGRPVLDVRYARAGQERAGLAIHRASLFAALWDGVQARGVPLFASSRIVGRRDGCLLTAQGPTMPFDLIVDALGHRSPLSPLVARPLPFGAIWGTVDWPVTDLPGDELRQCYRAADRMLGVLPIGTMPGGDRPQAAIFWSLPADGHPAWLARGLAAWTAEATALWPAFAPFAAQITDPAQMTLARYSHGTLRRPYGTGIVHIGDAAHRASPQLGQGANMALLDALALARALAQSARPGMVADALGQYARARRWHVRLYQAFSRAFTPQYQSDSHLLPVLRDRLLFPLSQTPPLPGMLSDLVAGSLIPPLAGLSPKGGSGMDERR